VSDVPDAMLTESQALPDAPAEFAVVTVAPFVPPSAELTLATTGSPAFVYTETVVDRLRSFRVSDGVWLQAVEIAKQRGESLSEVLRDALRRYVRRNQ
jgi:hypothetical protein